MQQIIGISDHENIHEQDFAVKKWTGKNRLYVENNGESLDVRCQSGSHPSMWTHIGQYSQVGSWIGYYYEAWVRSILTEHSDIKVVRKITAIQWKVAKILEEQKSEDFRRSLPDLLVEKEDGSLAFLEIKAFAP